MNAIVIGASAEAIYAIRKAQSKGIHVIAFDGNKDAEGLKYADESYVVDIREPENIFGIIDGKGMKSSDMFVLPVPLGRQLIAAGAFNENYDLIGPKRQTTELCTDKWLFHETMSQNGLRNADCRLVTAGQLPQTPAKFPVIVKPRFGAGSRQVVQVSDYREWSEMESSFPFDEDFVIEDAVAGTEYGIDGFVHDDQFELVLLRKKLLTPYPYRQCVGYISVPKGKEPEINQTMQAYMESLISKIGLKDGIVHADIIMAEDGPFVIEMSARPSGHRLHNLFTPMATGIDMISDFIDIACGKDVLRKQSEDDSIYMIRYFDMESEIRQIPEKNYLMDKYGILDYECNLTVGEVKKIIDGHSLMGRGYFIIKGDTEEVLCETADSVLKEFI